MKTTWIVAADASRARVLQVASRTKLAEIASLDNPQGRLHDRDLLADGYPRFRGPRMRGSASDGPGSDRQETSATEHATEMFAKRIGEYLEKARTKHRYDKLVVIAPPHLLGALRKEYGKEVGKLVAEEVPKDLSWLSKHELEGYFSKDGRAL
jgi:protein required for attachment to host cells